MKFDNKFEYLNQEDINKINESVIDIPFTIKLDGRFIKLKAINIDNDFKSCENNCIFYKVCKFKEKRTFKINISCFSFERCDNKDVYFIRIENN